MAAIPAVPYYFQAPRVWDPVNDAPVPSAVIEWFDEDDTTYASPLNVWHADGTDLGSSMTANASADGVPYVLAVPFGIAKSGTWISPVASHRGLREAVLAAEASAQAAAAAAQNTSTTGGPSMTVSYQTVSGAVTLSSSVDLFVLNLTTDTTLVFPTLEAGFGHVFRAVIGGPGKPSFSSSVRWPGGAIIPHVPGSLYEFVGTPSGVWYVDQTYAPTTAAPETPGGGTQGDGFTAKDGAPSTDFVVDLTTPQVTEGQYVLITVNPETASAAWTIPTLPTGVTELVAPTYSGTAGFALYGYVVPASPPASLTFTAGASMEGSTTWSVINGVDGAAPLSSVVGMSGWQSGTTHTAPSVNVPDIGAQVFGGLTGPSGDFTVTPPAGWTQLVNATDRRGYVARKSAVTTTTGQSGVAQFTHSGDATVAMAWQVALAPAVVPVGGAATQEFDSSWTTSWPLSPSGAYRVSGTWVDFTDNTMRPTLATVAGGALSLTVPAGLKEGAAIVSQPDKVNPAHGYYTTKMQPSSVAGAVTGMYWQAANGLHEIAMQYLTEDPANIRCTYMLSGSSTSATVSLGFGTYSLPASGAVASAVETPAFATGTGDIADDPEIWVDPVTPGNSLVFGTRKDSGGGIAVYNLDGTLRQFLAVGEMNNVDLRTDAFGSSEVVLLSTNRTTNALNYFILDTTARTISAAGSTTLGYEPYGASLFKSPVDGKLYAFVTSRYAPYQFDQWELSIAGSTVSGTKVRDMTTSTLCEGMVAHDATSRVFLAEEDLGIFVYAAEPGGSSTRSTVALITDGDLVADVEGLSIAHDPAGGAEYLLASSQGDSSLHVYDLSAPYAHQRRFTVTGSGTVDAVSATDGVAVTRENLGATYPNGLVVVHDSVNTGGTTSNYKFIDAALMFGTGSGSPTYAHAAYHEYGFLWTPTGVVWTVDGAAVHSVTNAAFANLGTGVLKLAAWTKGSAVWGGGPPASDATNAFDYVRYNADVTTLPGAGADPGTTDPPVTPSDAVGVPAGTVLSASGQVTITTPGTVLDALDINGGVIVNVGAGNTATITRCRITGPSDLFYTVHIQSGSVTIQNCEIIGGKNGVGSGSPVKTIQKTHIHHCLQDGIKAGTGDLIEDCRIDQMGRESGAHADCIQLEGNADGVIIRRNTLICIDLNGDYGTSAILLKKDFGATSAGPVTIEDNYLEGGGYTLYAVPGGADMTGATTSNVTIQRNTFGPLRRYDGTYAWVLMPVTFASSNRTTSGATVVPRTTY